MAHGGIRVMNIAKYGVAQFLYQLVLFIFVLVDGARWLIQLAQFSLPKSLQPDRDKLKRDWGWGQKYGLPIGTRIPKSNRKRVLIHCASMGEVVAAAPVIKQLLAQSAELELVITTNTLTGKEQVYRTFNYELSSSDCRLYHRYLPVDLGFLIRRFLRSLSLDMLLIMEVELWPNLLINANQLGIQTGIINARMTDKTRRGYLKLSLLSKPMLHAIDKVFARNQNDVDNYLQLGLQPNKITLAGNVKFDMDLPSLELGMTLREKMALTEKRVVLIGSSHDGEETLALNMLKRLINEHADLCLLIAPRHPHRFETVCELVETTSFNYQRYSDNKVLQADTQVMVVDAMGHLSSLYGVADIVMVGGSYANRGGHNPIEPAAYAKPILMGQHYHNNPELVLTLQQSGGLYVFNSEQEFVDKVSGWLSEPETAEEAGQKGLQCLTSNQGAVSKIVEYVTTVLRS